MFIVNNYCCGCCFLLCNAGFVSALGSAEVGRAKFPLLLLLLLLLLSFRERVRYIYRHLTMFYTQATAKGHVIINNIANQNTQEVIKMNIGKTKVQIFGKCCLRQSDEPTNVHKTRNVVNT